MASGAPSPIEHPGRNLREAVCLRSVKSAAEKHAIGLLDDRVNPHLVRKPGMMCVQNLTPDGLVGVLKPCCTIVTDRTEALTTPHRINLLQPAASPLGGLTSADAPLIDAEILFRQPGTAHLLACRNWCCSKSAAIWGTAVVRLTHSGRQLVTQAV